MPSKRVSTLLKVVWRSFYFSTLWTVALSTAIFIYLLKFTLGSIPVHIALLSLYLNYILLVLFPDVSAISKFLSIVTFFINYCILFGRLFMYYFLKRTSNVVILSFLAKLIFLGLRCNSWPMVLGSKYSGVSVHQKWTNSWARAY